MSYDGSLGNSPFDEHLIREYLLDNPEFFSHHPEILLAMRLPHAERGTISLVERRQELLRARVSQLEEEITGLLTEARRNESIFRFNNELQFKLLSCDNMGELRQCLAAELMAFAGFSHVRLINLHEKEGELGAIWNHRLASDHYFGRLTALESRRLFAAEVGSVALCRLADSCGQVVFAIASPDPAHFNPSMDNMLLGQLCRVLEHILPRL